ncbi:MAG: acyl-CoA reductase [Chloroflexota bacterium]|nr:acyl-CoA reductase [Chloroflexota bacterium]PLS80181.1 MAG: acyl-CoA reductase [Chloroflexota bacterium]
MTATQLAYDAWLLPGLDPEEVIDWYTVPDVSVDDQPLRFPRLSSGQLEQVLDRLTAARQQYLVTATTRQLIDLIDATRARWLDYTFPWRAAAERILPTITGYTLAMVRRGLDDYLSLFKRDNLKALVRAELGDLDILDQFRERRIVPGRSRAFGPALTTHVFSGNVPGLPAQSLIAALLLKSASFGKLAAGEPVFAGLFARSLIELEPRLSDCFAVTWWPGGAAPEVEAIAFARSQAVIAYGGETAIRSIAERIPAGVRFLPYGHKLSFGVIGREGLINEIKARQLASRAAYDVAKFDQQGCVSPHLFYVEAGGEISPHSWARLLAAELARFGRNMPRGRLAPSDSAAVASFRRDVDFRASLDPDALALLTAPDADGGATVVFDADPTFTGSCLNRTVLVKPLAQAEAIIELLQPVRAFVQTAALALDPLRRDALAGRLGAAGVTRICPLGKMPDPDLAWHHDGRFNLLDLVYWADIEEGYPL